MTAYDTVTARLAERTGGTGRGGSWPCPAHDDSTPSLSVTNGNDKVLMHCHAGCSIDDILAALGLDPGDLFDTKANGHGDEIVDIYDYVGEDGTLLFQVVRKVGKRFVQRRPDGAGGWIWKLDKTRRVIYRLPRVLEAVAAGETVYVVEGEKDVHALEGHGVTATCNPGGAGKWLRKYAATFEGADVVVIADLDDPGRAHARDVASQLEDVAKSVRVVMPYEGKDASDHFQWGHGLGEFLPIDHDDKRASVDPCTLTEAHDVFRRWLGNEYDIDAFNASAAVTAAERLDGDPVWLLVLSGSGNAKTETVQAFEGAGALIKSTLTGEAALLSGTPKKERAKDAHGGILRQIGDRGLLVIKDFTSILAMNRDIRGRIIAALREIHDGRWVRDMGGEGGRTLEWTGRIGIIGAVTTAWDRAHDVIASMGDRFLILRMDSTSGRLPAGRKAIGNTSHETTMRAELAAAAAGVIAGVDPSNAVTVTDDETELLLAAADLTTLARTGVDYDWKGNVIDAHAPEMPTRFAKELTQVVRGSVAIGMERTDALRLAIRCARDSMPPLRLAILDDVAANPGTSAAATRKRLEKPWSTIDRQLQSLYILGVLTCEEVEDAKGWRYQLADGIDPTALVSPDLSPPSPSPLREREERERNDTSSEATPVPPSDKSGDGSSRACTQCGGYATDISSLCASCLSPGELGDDDWREF